MPDLDFNVLDDGDSHRELANLIDAINAEGWQVAADDLEYEGGSGKVYVRLTCALPCENRDE